MEEAPDELFRGAGWNGGSGSSVSDEAFDVRLRRKNGRLESISDDSLHLSSSDEEGKDVPRWMKVLVQSRRGALVHVEDERIFWGFNHPDPESERQELLTNQTYYNKLMARARLRVPWIFTRKQLNPVLLRRLNQEILRIAYLKKSPRVPILLHDRQRQARRASLIQKHLEKNVLYDRDQFAPSSSVKPYQNAPRYLYIDVSVRAVKEIGEALDSSLVRYFEEETRRHAGTCEEGRVCLSLSCYGLMGTAGYGMLYRRRVVDEKEELNFPGPLVLVLSSEIQVPSSLVAVANLSHGFKVVELLSRLDVDEEFRCVTAPDLSYAKCKMQASRATLRTKDLN
ncbi:hypothetical protein GUITHDRAFT_100263 [Guillardia theta CCMP2712]|uniref:PH domain-containing protein n=1 Tax=Guillardia theta (strain CCMP2712) TaxID=905079 RepID=L1K064_GUITC|nr:hypothetical protein GUITHDRAFT_100263 [Guillardia theta CCMP2712]EKX54012.1 hypothetical protein GUITHDRAFT_100263 [Guillardia theta CCMP2712]|eukprot:XP_005840992.1 hypothetical protein GUITHDRAFT_100263 [Guillardia theta CCMP2712]